MVNSATADAFRPGVLTTRIFRLRAAAMSMFTGAPARDGDELQSGQPLEHSGGEGREMGDGDLGAVHMRHHLVCRALIFLQPLHSRLDISVLHRLVRPGHLVRSDLGSFSALLAGSLFSNMDGSMKRSPMMEMIGLGRARSLLKRRTPV